VSGKCVGAQIADPEACGGPTGCDESALGNPDLDGGTAQDSGSSDAGDAPAPAGSYNDVTLTANWSTFDTTTISPNAAGFFGATFDGRYVYVYLVPDDTDFANGIVTRYDTQAAFAQATSWSIFDTSVVNPNANGFTGAAFDGRHVYLVPNKGSAGVDGLVTSYDTQASFTSADSWLVFDTTTVNANAKGFTGAVFDGRFLYLVPNFSGTNARYDTQASFTAAASWSTFDLGSVIPNARGFFGGAFDGRYVYLVPLEKDGGYDGVVTRYDTQAPFANAASWSTFDTTSVNSNAKGFAGAAFDGRYVYLVPYTNAVSPTGNAVPDGLVARYDTQAPFTTTASWSTFDLAALNAVGFTGAAFDGRYVYFVPDFAGVVARFDARTPPSMPKLPAFFGSFL
jgi:hypothetical protein